MCDLWSLYYFSPTEQKFLRRLPKLLSTIADRYCSIDPVEASAFSAVAQVLTGFLPLNAGQALIQVGQLGGTYVEIKLQGPQQPLSITVQPKIHSEIVLPTYYAFGLFPDDRSVSSSPGGMHLALNLFELMARKDRAMTDLVVYGSDWNWVNSPQASSYWWKRAAEATRARALPPRAIHWMANPHEDSED